jgi:cephalosporin hydroxylase
MSNMEDSLRMRLDDVLKRMQKRILNGTTYFGIQTLKQPLDFWVYQELIHEFRPDVIIEVGSYKYGFTLALAHLCDNIGNGRVIGIEIEPYDVPEQVKNHKRIKTYRGDAVTSFEAIAKTIKSGESVMVIEDSSHTYDNTLRVMEAYSKLIHVGGWLIVEDGICHHGLKEGPKPGPYEAIVEFLRRHDEFKSDRDKEGFFITWNPKGFIRRIR